MSLLLIDGTVQRSPMDRLPEGDQGGNLGGLAGQRKTLHRKNSIFVSFIPFRIRLTKKILKKALI